MIFCIQNKEWWNYVIYFLVVQELVALFLFKTRTYNAKNSCEFFVDVIFCFVKIYFERKCTNTK